MINTLTSLCVLVCAIGPGTHHVNAADTTSRQNSMVQLHAAPASLTMYGVHIVTLRATLLGSPPEQRVATTKIRIQEALDNVKQGVIRVDHTDIGVTIMIDGRPTVFLTSLDYDPSVHAGIADVVPIVKQRLRELVEAWKEQQSVPDILLSIGLVVVATIVYIVIIRIVLRARRRIIRRIFRRTVRRLNRQGMHQITGTMRFVPMAIVRLISTITYAFALLLLYAYVTFSLNRFPITRTLGHQMSDFVYSAVLGVTDDVVATLPNLITILIIIFIARFISRLLRGLAASVQRGQLTLPLVDKDTIVPTRRILSVVLWVFALVLIYPLVPGSSSQAFQGVSVLFGLMLSLGASSTVGQAMAGMVLLYSRTLRVGDFVTVNETTGRVQRLGYFAVRLQTAYQEEVSIPNSVLITSRIVNHSRLVQRGTTFSTTLTIGYDTSWRLVHQIMLDATLRVPNVEQTNPRPYITQSALSDFYVQYTLTCAFKNADERWDSMSELHAALQDEFNKHGVQIMSPHYVLDPKEPKIVPPSNVD